MNNKNQDVTTEVVKEVEKSEVALREEAMQAFWEKEDIFNKSLETPAGSKPKGDFVFYDGPPFATGLPHYGHILASTIKDAIPRFWTMNGYHVRRQWGWDCHGLPLENLIEKKLGLATKKDIEEYGIKNFNEQARGAVMEYADEWARIIPRMGRWADMENDYKTMDSTYTESVWWVFSELNKKGLVFEGFKSMHLCPRCGTTLSNFEVNQGYKDIKDLSVTVRLPLLDDAGEKTDTSLLVWTTTPWTLPGNLAAAVNNEHTYVKVKVTKEGESELVIVAKERLVQLGTEDYEIVEELKGSELVGKKYEPPFAYLAEQDIEGKENAWQILHADYVELGDEGTGAVHIAPAYGDDDMKLAQSHNVPIHHHVDAGGHFEEFVTDFAGQLVKPKDDDESGVNHMDADIEIIRALAGAGKLYSKEKITHSYPHCWRCDTPLLNYATTSWFVDVPAIKDQLVAENKKVNWVPEHVGTNRFGKWLDGARDWAVSRQRYWGAPLPIWRSPDTKDYKVFGSLKEIQEYVPKSGNTFKLMRHGESESNLKAVISGKIDGSDSLTEKGIQQSKEVAKDLKDIDLIIYSGFKRTKTTAEIVAKELGLNEDQVIEDKRIIEIQMPDEMQGKSWSEYDALFPTTNDKYTKHIEGFENRLDVRRRIGEFLFETDKKYQNKNILVVSHGGCIKEMQGLLKGTDLKGAEQFFETVSYFKNTQVAEHKFVAFPHNDDYLLDFHRPYIDEVELFEGETKLERVPDVFDCWFESGSMPYAQYHYPFENETDFEKKLFPANFIAEGLDQTRGWFYSLIVLGTALFGKSPFENVIVNGLALAEDGKKMSKSLQNYPDPMDVANSAGADAMRFYLLSSPIVRGEDLNFSEKGVLELQRKNIGRLHNVLTMFKQYVGEGVEARSDSTQVLDQWIVSRTNQLVKETTEGYKNYELDRAVRPVTDYIDDLSVWYLRRSRERLKGNDAKDKEATLATLQFCLENLALVMAPVMPFYSEYLWQEIGGAKKAQSVHLAGWPEAQKIDESVIEKMSATRDTVTLALEQRAKAKIKIRQPLAKLTVSAELDADYLELIKDEVNIKEVMVNKTAGEKVELDLEISDELKAEGDMRELVRGLQDMRKQAGLSPEDVITLTLQTSDSGEELVKKFESEISKTVNAKEILFADADGVEIKAGDSSFTAQIEKLS